MPQQSTAPCCFVRHMPHGTVLVATLGEKETDPHEGKGALRRTREPKEKPTDILGKNSIWSPQQ
jgi:hypothetical protein